MHTLAKRLVWALAMVFALWFGLPTSGPNAVQADGLSDDLAGVLDDAATDSPLAPVVEVVETTAQDVAAPVASPNAGSPPAPALTPLPPASDPSAGTAAVASPPEAPPKSQGLEPALEAVVAPLRSTPNAGEASLIQPAAPLVETVVHSVEPVLNTGLLPANALSAALEPALSTLVKPTLVAALEPVTTLLEPALEAVALVTYPVVEAVAPLVGPVTDGVTSILVASPPPSPGESAASGAEASQHTGPPANSAVAGHPAGPLPEPGSGVTAALAQDMLSGAGEDVAPRPTAVTGIPVSHVLNSEAEAVAGHTEPGVAWAAVSTRTAGQIEARTDAAHDLPARAPGLPSLFLRGLAPTDPSFSQLAGTGIVAVLVSLLVVLLKPGRARDPSLLTPVFASVSFVPTHPPD